MGLAEELLRRDKDGGGSEKPSVRPSSRAIRDLYKALKSDGLTEDQFERKFRATVKATLDDN